MLSSTDLKSLRAELTSAGLFTHRTGATLRKGVVLMLSVAGLIAAAIALPWWCSLFLAPLAAVPAVSFAMIAHEAAHGSLSSNKTLNQIVLHVVFPVFGGLGAQHWIHKHNHLHHGHPNVDGRDPDIDIWPMALTRSAYDDSGPFRQWIQRHLQAYLFWPLTLFLAVMMRKESFRHLVRRARAGEVNRGVILDTVCLLGHYALWIAVPMIWLDPLSVLAFYGGLWATGGLLLSLVFAPAHMGLPVVDSHDDPWLHQLASTRDFDMPRAMSWFFIGLDHQVEHHLFPRIPHQNLPRAREIARAWCKRTGAPFQIIGFGAGVADVTRHLRNSWQEVPAVPVQESMLASG